MSGAPEAAAGDATLLPRAGHASLAGADKVLVGAEEEGQPVGFLVAYVLDRVDGDRRMVCLYEIEVAEGYRRRGIGAALVDALRALCRGRGVTKIWVIASRSNAA